MHRLLRFVSFACEPRVPLARFNDINSILAPFGHADFIDHQRGLIPPPSYVSHWVGHLSNYISEKAFNRTFQWPSFPHIFACQMLPYTDHMTFAERWFNTVVGFYDWFVRYSFYLPNERSFAEKNFAHLAPLPPLEELIRNVSLTLVNSHRAITPPRPSMPSNFIN